MTRQKNTKRQPKTAKRYLISYFCFFAPATDHGKVPWTEQSPVDYYTPSQFNHLFNLKLWDTQVVHLKQESNGEQFNFLHFYIKDRTLSNLNRLIPNKFIYLSFFANVGTPTPTLTDVCETSYVYMSDISTAHTLLGTMTPSKFIVHQSINPEYALG